MKKNHILKTIAVCTLVTTLGMSSASANVEQVHAMTGPAPVVMTAFTQKSEQPIEETTANYSMGNYEETSVITKALFSDSDSSNAEPSMSGTLAKVTESVVQANLASTSVSSATAYVMNSASTTVVNTSPIKVYVNNERVSFAIDAQPVMIDNRTLVPLRSVLETMGYTVTWDNDVWTGSDEYLQSLYGTTNPTLITISSGENALVNPILIQKDNVIMQNDMIVETDVDPRLIDTYYYLPLRIIAESTGAIVDWDNDTRSVYITFTPQPASTSSEMVNTNMGKDYVGIWGDGVDNELAMNAGLESVNLQNYSHKMYYENAPKDNPDGLPEGAYYVSSDNIWLGSEQVSANMGAVTTVTGQTIYLGEHKNSVEAKLGEATEVREYNDGTKSYRYIDTLGLSLKYSATGRIVSMSVYCTEESGYKNQGFTYGGCTAKLGYSTDSYEKQDFMKGYDFATFYYFGLDNPVHIKVGTKDGKFIWYNISLADSDPVNTDWS